MARSSSGERREVSTTSPSFRAAGVGIAAAACPADAARQTQWAASTSPRPARAHACRVRAHTPVGPHAHAWSGILVREVPNGHAFETPRCPRARSGGGPAPRAAGRASGALSLRDDSSGAREAARSLEPVSAAHPGDRCRRRRGAHSIRHSQGDRWDLLVIFPTGSFTDYYSRERVGRREMAAKTSGLDGAAYLKQMYDLIAWHEDVLSKGRRWPRCAPTSRTRAWRISR